jgi:predicted transcriptional regulator
MLRSPFDGVRTIAAEVLGKIYHHYVARGYLELRLRKKSKRFHFGELNMTNGKFDGIKSNLMRVVYLDG